MAFIKIPFPVGTEVYTVNCGMIDHGVIDFYTVSKDKVLAYDKYGCMINGAERIYKTREEAENELYTKWRDGSYIG